MSTVLLCAALACPLPVVGDQGTVIQIVDTTGYVSTDPSGLALDPTRNLLLLVDSEVEETGFYSGSSFFAFDSDGTVLLAASTLHFSSEPTDVAVDDATGQYFITDDDQREVFRVELIGPDLVLQDSFDTATLGIMDPEGVILHPTRGTLFLADGAQGGNAVHELSTSGAWIDSWPPPAEATDLEAITYDPDTDRFLLVGGKVRTVFLVDASGNLIDTIDLQAIQGQFGGKLTAKGLMLAESSDPTDAATNRSLWFADYGRDEVNDGRLFELTYDDPPLIAALDDILVEADIPLRVDLFAEDGDGTDDTFDWFADTLPAFATLVDDGNGAAHLDLSPTLADLGDHPVSIRVTAHDGTPPLSTSRSATITVYDGSPPNRPPVPEAGPDQFAEAGEVLTFDGSQSSDPDGDPLNFSWDFGDGSPAESGAQVTHAYAADGSYTVTLTVDDGEYFVDDTLVVEVDSGLFPLSYELSFAGSAQLPGIGGSVRDEDIVRYDADLDTYELVFDLSDVGVRADVWSFFRLSSGEYLMTFASEITIPGLIGGPEGEWVRFGDVVRFTPTSGGTDTNGSFTFVFDASDVGLSDKNERLDGLWVAPTGEWILSTSGVFEVPGLSGKDEDLIQFNPVSLGENTAGTFEMVFDGSDVQMTAGGEDIDAVYWADGVIYFSVTGSFSVQGIEAADEDILAFFPISLGQQTAGTVQLFLDGSEVGFGDEDLDGFQLDE